MRLTTLVIRALVHLGLMPPVQDLYPYLET